MRVGGRGCKSDCDVDTMIPMQWELRFSLPARYHDKGAGSLDVASTTMRPCECVQLHKFIVCTQWGEVNVRKSFIDTQGVNEVSVLCSH